jgi:hypothetical protein
MLVDIPPDEGVGYFQVTALGGDDVTNNPAFDVCRQISFFSR